MSNPAANVSLAKFRDFLANHSTAAQAEPEIKAMFLGLVDRAIESEAKLADYARRLLPSARAIANGLHGHNGPGSLDGLAIEAITARCETAEADREAMREEIRALRSGLAAAAVALREVDTIACREDGASTGPEPEPPEPCNRDGQELASVARAALKDLDALGVPR